MKAVEKSSINESDIIDMELQRAPSHPGQLDLRQVAYSSGNNNKPSNIVKFKTLKPHQQKPVKKIKPKIKFEDISKDGDNWKMEAKSKVEELEEVHVSPLKEKSNSREPPSPQKVKMVVEIPDQISRMSNNGSPEKDQRKGSVSPQSPGWSNQIESVNQQDEITSKMYKTQQNLSLKKGLTTSFHIQKT